MTPKVQGFEVWETIGVSIPNPRSVVRMPIPPGLTPEQLARIEAEINRINAELEAQLKAEMDLNNAERENDG